MAISFPRFQRDHEIFHTNDVEMMDSNISAQTRTATDQHQSPENSRPAMPMPCWFMNIPIELQQMVAREVLRDPNKIRRATNMEALLATNKSIKKNLEYNAKNATANATARKHTMDKTVLKEIYNLLPTQLSTAPVSTLQLLKATKRMEALNMALSETDEEERLTILSNWAQRLPALSEDEQKKLINFASEFEDPDFEDHIADLIGNMGSGLHVLDSDQHTALVEKILDMEGSGQGRAILGFGEGLHSLDADLKRVLINATFYIENDEHLSDAICGLAKGFDALTPIQCTDLAKAALTIQNETFFADALRALGPYLALLQPTEQNALIHGACNLPDPDKRSSAINALTKSLTKLENNQYIDLLRDLGLVAANISEKHEASFIYSCGTELKASDDPNHKHLHNALVIEALAMPEEEHRSYAIAGLAAALPILDISDRALLVTATLKLTSEQHKATALTGLLENQNNLTNDQKASLFDAMLNLPNRNKATAIFKLSTTAVGLFDLSQREHLITATLAMNNETYKSRAIAGLGKGSAHLTDSQIEQLVDATSSLADEKNMTRAIIGLAGIQGKQRESLIKCFEDELSGKNKIKAIHALAEHII